MSLFPSHAGSQWRLSFGKARARSGFSPWYCVQGGQEVGPLTARPGADEYGQSGVPDVQRDMEKQVELLVQHGEERGSFARIARMREVAVQSALWCDGRGEEACNTWVMFRDLETGWRAPGSASAGGRLEVQQDPNRKAREQDPKRRALRQARASSRGRSMEESWTPPRARYA